MTKIAGKTLSEWKEFARRDDCLDNMVPSDLRSLIGAIESNSTPTLFRNVNLSSTTLEWNHHAEDDCYREHWTATTPFGTYIYGITDGEHWLEYESVDGIEKFDNINSVSDAGENADTHYANLININVGI